MFAIPNGNSKAVSFLTAFSLCLLDAHPFVSDCVVIFVLFLVDVLLAFGLAVVSVLFLVGLLVNYMVVNESHCSFLLYYVLLSFTVIIVPHLG
jgi:hypothetical protein